MNEKDSKRERIRITQGMAKGWRPIVPPELLSEASVPNSKAERPRPAESEQRHRHWFGVRPREFAIAAGAFDLKLTTPLIIPSKPLPTAPIPEIHKNIKLNADQNLQSLKSTDKSPEGQGTGQPSGAQIVSGPGEVIEKKPVAAPDACDEKSRPLNGDQILALITPTGDSREDKIRRQASIGQIIGAPKEAIDKLIESPLRTSVVEALTHLCTTAENLEYQEAMDITHALFRLQCPGNWQHCDLTKTILASMPTNPNSVSPWSDASQVFALAAWMAGVEPSHLRPELLLHGYRDGRVQIAAQLSLVERFLTPGANESFVDRTQLVQAAWTAVNVVLGDCEKPNGRVIKSCDIINEEFHTRTRTLNRKQLTRTRDNGLLPELQIPQPVVATAMTKALDGG